jgi:hypothetical protein
VTRPAHRLLLVVLAAAVLALAGCAEGASARDRLADAADATRGAGSASASVSVVTTFTGVDDPMLADSEITGEGAFDFAGDRGHLAMQMPGMEDAGLDQVETVFLDGVVYSQLPMPGGVQWLRIDTAELGTQGLQQLGGTSDPSANLDLLEGARDVEEVGEVQVRGATTTHYRFTVDLEAAGEEADAEQRQMLDSMRQQLGTSELPMEVWLDSDDRVRRQRSEIDLDAMHAQGQTASGGTVVTVVELHDFGVDVEVEAPPEEDTVDIQDLDPSFGQPAPIPGRTEPGTAEVVPDAEGTQPIEPPSAQPLPDDDSGEADV